MKYVLVLIVSLLGLNVFPSSGVSVSKILEGHAKFSLHNNLKSGNNNSPTENNTTFLELIFSTDRPKRTNLEIKRIKIDEQAFYEGDGKNKENSINERSYIVIDQRFKVPMLNQLYSGQVLAHSGRKHYKTFVSNLDSDSKFFNAFHDIPDLSKVVTLKPYVDPNVEKDNRVSYYVPLKRKNYNSEQKNGIINEINNLKNKVQAANRAIGHQYEDKRKNNKTKDAFIKTKGVFDERLEYLELLKPPLIRTGAKTVNDRKDNINRAGSTENVDYDNKAPPGYNSKSLGTAYPTFTAPIETRKSTHYESESFPKEKQSFHTSNMAWKMEEIKMNRDGRLEESGNRASEEDQEVLDKDIQINSSEKMTEEKKNTNDSTNLDQGKNRCIAPGCIANQEKATSKSNDFNCKCDFHVEQYLKSDVNEIVEVGEVAPPAVRKKSE